jgi:hypothetical protein
VSQNDQCRTGCGRPWPCGCGPAPLSQVEPGGGGFETPDERRVDDLERGLNRVRELIEIRELAEAAVFGRPRSCWAQLKQEIDAALARRG